MLFNTCQAMGELAIMYPVSGGFYNLSNRFIDKSWGFAMGWNYVFQWAVVLPLEITAAGVTIGVCFLFSLLKYRLTCLQTFSFGERQLILPSGLLSSCLSSSSSQYSVLSASVKKSSGLVVSSCSSSFSSFSCPSSWFAEGDLPVETTATMLVAATGVM